MKSFTNKNWIKKIIISIIILISFSFVVPNYSHAGTLGGDLFKPIAQLICDVGDLVIKGLQLMFMGDGDIRAESPDTARIPSGYLIRYSPGIIFTGTIPGLDVNFINPMPPQKIYTTSDLAGSWDKGTNISLGNLKNYNCPDRIINEIARISK